MNIEFLKDEKERAHVRFENEDKTFAAALEDELWATKGVEAVAVDKKHPLIGKPELILHGKDPKKLMKEAAQSYKKKVEEFQKAILKEV